MPEPSQPSLESIYRRHWRYVWRCVRKMGIPDARIEDVVQDVFVVVSRTLDDFEGRSAIRTWLYSIAFRVAQEHHRKQAREQRPDPTVAKLQRTPEEHLQRAEAAATLHELLAELDEDKRWVFVQIEVEGRSAAAVAEELQLSVNTVYSRLRWARRNLERAVARRQARARSAANARVAEPRPTGPGKAASG